MGQNSVAPGAVQIDLSPTECVCRLGLFVPPAHLMVLVSSGSSGEQHISNMNSKGYFLEANFSHLLSA